MGTHAFSNDDDILQLHVSHCLDTIRQVLMCNIDTGVLGQVWTNPKAPEAFPDFNTQHKCKNYDAIKQWAIDHQVCMTMVRSVSDVTNSSIRHHLWLKSPTITSRHP